MRFELWSIPFRLHPLTILAALLACKFGLTLEIAAVMISLCAHEMAHLLAARALGVEILRVDLMPFGGSARMINPYALGYARLAGVALAGPTGSLSAMIVSAALGWSGWIDFGWASLLVQTNLLLMLFNLLPALPLDGGRLLYCALAPKFGQKVALAAGIWAGRILAAALLASAAMGFIYARTVNLTILLTAVFILAAASDEQESARMGRVTSISKAGSRKREPHRLMLIALDARCRALDAAKTLRVGDENLYAIYAEGELQGFVEQDEIRRRISREDGQDVTAPLFSDADLLRLKRSG